MWKTYPKNLVFLHHLVYCGDIWRSVLANKKKSTNMTFTTDYIWLFIWKETLKAIQCQKCRKNFKKKQESQMHLKQDWQSRLRCDSICPPVLLRCWAVVSFLRSSQAAGLLNCSAAAAALFFLVSFWPAGFSCCWAAMLQSCWAAKLTNSRKGVPWCQEGLPWC